MSDIVERPLDVSVENPFTSPDWCGDVIDSADDIMTSATWSKAVTARLEASLPVRFEGVLDHGLHGAV